MLSSQLIFHQTLALSSVFINEFLMGLGYGWTAPTLRILQDTGSEISLDTIQSSWVASLHDFGRMFGPLLSVFLLDTAGRKFILTTCTIVFFLMWLLIIFTRSVPVIYLVRLTFGIGVGMNDTTSTIYLAENCHPQLRGAFGGISVAFFYTGILVEFILAAYLSYNTVAIINTTVGVLALSTIFFSTETAQYLIIKEKNESALKNFSWLKGGDSTVKEMYDEFEKLRKQVHCESEKKLTLITLVSTPLYYKTIIIVLAFCCFTMGSGFAAVSAFASVTFIESDFTPEEFTILLGALQLISVVISSFVIERLNRKTIMKISFSLAAFVHFCTALLFYMQTFSSIPFFSWYVFSTITLYSMIYSMGILPIVFIIRGELLPQNVKAVGSALAIVLNSLVAFSTAKAFLLVADMYGIYMNFLFFGTISFAGVLFVHCALPETRGKSLAEIQHALMKSK